MAFQQSCETKFRVARLGARILLVTVMAAGAPMVFAQSADDAAKQLQELPKSGNLTPEQKKALDSQFQHADQWSAADRARLFVQLAGFLGGRDQLLGELGYVNGFSSAMLDALGKIDEAQYQRFKLAQDIDPKKPFTDNPFRKDSSYDLRYLVEQAMKKNADQYRRGVYDLTASFVPAGSDVKYSYDLKNLGDTPICDFVLTFTAPQDALTEQRQASDMAKDITPPPGWKNVERMDANDHFEHGSELVFETDDPANCLTKGQIATFAFSVSRAHFSIAGEAGSSVSTLRNGKHETFNGMNWGIFAPLLDVEPRTAPEGSTVTMTGEVVEGKPATISVRGQSGDALEGVVVDANGKKYVTNALGMATLAVPMGAAVLTAKAGGATAAVAKVTTAAPTTGAPAITAATNYVTTGGTMTISGSGFSGTAPGNTVTIAGQPAQVLASSPTAIVAQVPANATLGDGQLLEVAVSGRSAARNVSVVRLEMTTDGRALTRGQKATATVHVLGTLNQVVVSMTNQSVGVIEMARGATTVTARSSGGANNEVKVSFRAVRAGTFRVQSQIVQQSTGR